MDSTNSHRIDRPNPTISGPTALRSRSRELAAVVAQSADAAATLQNGSDCQDGWLRLQAADLIGQLQQLSADLDAREAQLNVRLALQDNRERKFRLLQQDALAGQSEQQRAIDRQQRELETQLRQLAFREQ